MDVAGQNLVDTSAAHVKARVEKIGKNKVNLLAVISHELRAPLTVMLGLIELLEQDVQGEVGLERVQLLKKTSRFLLSIANDVLDICRIESGHLVVEQQPFSVADLLDQLQAFSASASKSDLALRFEEIPEVMPIFVGDQRRIMQVLGNLVGNAIKFTDRGMVVVTARLIDQSASAGRLRFEVSDTGKGIDREHLPRVFLPFMQFDAVPGLGQEGAGLGLSISKDLVELMGGSIGVESEPGAGSTFWVELPLAIAQPVGEEYALGQYDGGGSPAVADEQPLKGVRILVVDDSLSIRELVSTFLIRAGAAVELAENGAVALGVLERSGLDIDCVMMDVQMPVMDGLTACRYIRAHPDLQQMPVLAMTAGMLEEQQMQVRRAGMTGIITKPMIPGRMIEQVGAAVDRARACMHLADGVSNAIPPVQGIDRFMVHQIMDGNAEMFDFLAALFIDEFGHVGDAIVELLGQPGPRDRKDEAVKLLHSLCGSAAQIGAFAVKAAAEALHQAVLTGEEDLLGESLAVSDELEQLLHGLRTHLARSR